MGNHDSSASVRGRRRRRVSGRFSFGTGVGLHTVERLAGGGVPDAPRNVTVEKVNFTPEIHETVRSRITERSSFKSVTLGLSCFRKMLSLPVTEELFTRDIFEPLCAQLRCFFLKISRRSESSRRTEMEAPALRPTHKFV
jgi:hypothetical protein